MGQATREQMNANYKKAGKPLPYPSDKVAEEAVESPVIKEEEKKRGKK